MSTRKKGIPKKKLLITAVLAFVLLLTAAGLLRENALNTAQREFAGMLTEQAGHYNEGRLVLSATNNREAQQIADTLGGSLRITKNGRFALVTLPDGVTLADVSENRELRKYMAYFSLDYNNFSVGTEDTDVAADGDIRANFHSDEPMYPQQTYLDYINIGDSWNVSMGKKPNGEKVMVAIIDSGIDTDHPEFTDAEGNSIISKLSYDATDDIVVKADELDAIEDEQGHGTAVAGVIASQINGSGIMGIAPDVELLIIKCDVDETGKFKSSADIVFGIYYAIEHDADVITMSFGTRVPMPDLEKAIQLAVDSDIIPVAAAGNDSATAKQYPAAYDTAIGVGALAQDSWELADYSNYGDNSDIVAPGTTLTAAIGGGYAVDSGTSMAAPIVSAAVAIYRFRHPYATFEQVKNDLQAAGKDLGEVGEDLYFGFGALDMNAFICEEKGVITYDYCTEDLEATTQVFVKQHTIQTVPEPERENIVFDDWYYDKSYTRVFDYDAWYTTEFVEDMTLYAKWVNEEDEGVSVYSYKTLDDGTIEITSYKGKRRYLTVPDEIEGKTVSSIGISAFAGNTRLREIILPNGLTKIREYAFDGASRLRAVTFTGNALESIEARAFQDNSALRKLELPDSVVTIGSEAFADCAVLASVEITENSKLVSIGEKAFSKTALSYLYLPSGVSKFDGSVLAYCRNMRSVDIHPDNTAFAVQDGMVLSADGTALIYCPAARTGTLSVPEGVVTVGKYACTASSMTQLDLPESLEWIGVLSFAETKLAAVHIPARVLQIDPGAFKNCVQITELTFAEDSSLQIIGGNPADGGAFEGCIQVSSLELPESLVTLGERSFRGCSSIKVLWIPEHVATINASAFENCKELETVAFAENCAVSTVPKNCFAYCGKLQTVTFSDGIRKLDDFAFSSNYMLQTLNFGADSTLDSVGSNCFVNCYALKRMQLPESISTIGDSAYSFSGLTSVHVPRNLISIGDGAFGACYNLTEITVDADHLVYAAVDNVLFSKDITTVYCVPASRIGSYTLPDTVQITAPCSFYYDKYLTEVILPDGLLEIQHDSFYSCGSLQRIAIPDSVTSIGRMGFYYCYSLNNVTFGENSQLQRLGFYTFVNCGMTEITIPASVEEMAQYVFSNCSNLKQITFASGSKLPYVAAYLLSGTRVETVIFEDGSELTHLQAHAFDGAKYLKSVDFGDAALETVDNYAFYDCAKLKDITIPETVTYLGRYAFYGCFGLERFDIPSSVDYIGVSAFSGTNSKVFFEAADLPVNAQEGWDEGIAGYFLAAKEYVVTDEWEYIVTHSGSAALARYTGSATELTIDTVDGYQVEKIGTGCFTDNNTLTAVTLGANIREIDNYAFRDSGVVVVIPADSALERIGDYAFSGNATESLTLPDGVTHIGIGAFEGSDLKELIISADSALQTIGDRAFCAGSLESIDLPASLELVGVDAFKDTVLLKEVTIANSETALKLSNSAFEGSGMTEITIPARVKYIGEYAFGSCPNLEDIHVDDANAAYQDLDGVLLDSTGTSLIQYPGGRKGAYEIPEQITALTYACFKNAKGLTEVTFAADSGVRTIGWQTFCGCEQLAKITIPDTVVSFDFYAFDNCVSLTEVVLGADSQLTGIYEGAFRGCAGLTGLRLPDTVIDIGDYAFYGCSGLTEFPLTENAQTKGIGAHAFDGCTGITQIPVLKALVDVGEYAFAHTAISEFTVPASMKDISNNVFYGCENLMSIDCDEANEEYTAIDGILYEKGSSGGDDYDSVVIWPYGNPLIIGKGKTVITAEDTVIVDNLPGVRFEIADTVTSIGSKAFYEFRTMSEITLPENLTTIGDYAFYGCSSLKQIRIPEQVTALGKQCFSGCGRLKQVYYDAADIPDASVGSNPFPSAYGKGFEVVIGENVRRIPAYLFANSSVLRVLFAENSSCTSIGQFAFESCDKMYYAVIPKSVNTVGAGAFLSGNNNHLIVLEGSTYPQNVGMGWKGLAGVYKNLKEHGITDDGYFYGVKRDDTVVLGSYKGVQADILVPASYQGMPVSEIAVGTYCAKSYLRSVEVPDGVKVIGNTAFAACDALSKVRIPASVNTVGQGVFNGSDLLVSAGPIGSGCAIEFGWTTQIPGYAFDQHSHLTEILMPAECVSIGEQAFYNCTGLSSVEFPETLRHIGDSAYFGCSGITRVVLPGQMETVGDSAFSMCRNLEYVLISNDTVKLGIGTFAQANKLTSAGPVGGGYGIELAGTERVPENAFANCVSLTSVTIPDTVTAIGDGAFYGCTGLTEVTIPEQVQSLGSGIFYGCTKLGHLQINAVNLQDLPEGANIIEMAGSYDQPLAVTFGPGVTVVPARLFQDTVYSNYLGEVHFDEGSVCTKIGAHAFQECSKLSKIELPEGVLHIGDEAFAYCTGLQQIVIPESVVRFGTNAFVGNTKLVTAGPEGGDYDYAFGWKTEIPANAFAGCESLESVVLPESITQIGDYAFQYCGKLKQIDLPDAVVSIGSSAFEYCDDLKELVIPSGLEKMGYGAFQNCTGLERINYKAKNCKGTSGSFFNNAGQKAENLTITIGPDVTNTPDSLFAYTYVTDVQFEQSDTYLTIGSNAFARCTKLKRIVIPERVPLILWGAFSNCSSLRVVQIDSLEVQAWINRADDSGSLLSNAKLVLLPADAESVGPYITSNFTYLDSITINGTAYSCYSDHEHEWDEGQVITEVIECVQDGLTRYTCGVCGWDREVVVSCHSFGKWSPVTRPGCVTKGEDRRVCDLCGFVEIRETEALGHHYESELVPPTCTEQGYTLHACSACDAYYKDEFTDPFGHTEVWDPEVPASCTENGWTDGWHCSVCGEILLAQEEIPAWGHSMSGWETLVEPTCTEEGTARQKCYLCDYEEFDVIPAYGHYEVYTPAVDPTCTTPGWTEGIHCATCGHILLDREQIPAYGHRMKEWMLVREATCTEAGQEYRECWSCGFEEYRELPLAEHTVEIDESVPAACETTGLTEGSHCSVCGLVLTEREVTPALGHAWSAWFCYWEPTCVDSGMEGRYCGNCGKSEERELPPTGHAFGDWFINRRATCTENGENRRNCVNCDHYETKVIPAPGHDYESVVAAPTCTDRGYTTHTCTVCGDKYVDTYVDALGHDMSAWVTVTEAACTENGSERRDCSRCDHYETQLIAATGHSFGAWFVNRSATCTEDGENRRNCTNCSHYETEVIPATGHDYESVVTVPTCTEQGFTTYTCHCGDSYVDTHVDALGHDMDEWTTVTEATCTEGGSERRDCSRCDHYETRAIEATGHSYESAATAPTCTEQGFVTHTCSVCGDSFVDTYVDALGHDMDEWKTVTEACCTDDGSERRDCSRCDHHETRIIKATGHSFGAWLVNRAATCTEDGENRRNCTKCSHYETEVVPATGHDYESVVTAPTCTAQGYTTHTCTNCGNTYVDTYVDALGHDISIWKVVTEATCTTDGSERRDCSRCDYYETRVIEATGHSFGAWFVNRSATCMEDGENRRNCTKCSHYETEVIPATGHDYESVVTAPTCTAQGYTTHTCTNCGDTYVDTYVDALGHDISIWKVVTEATCTTDGSERRDCSRCDYYETRVIEAAGHSFGAWFVNRVATCTEDGETRRNCTNCSHYETEVIPATGHDYESVVTAPTCTEQGYTTHTCTNCSDRYVDSYIAALGHDWNDGVVTVEPTEESVGEMTYTCERCGATRAEVIPELEHEHRYDAVVTDPTCTDQGYTTHICRCGDSYIDTYVNALGHDMDGWKTVTEATCTKDGSERRDCSRCDHYETRTIESVGHSYESIVTAPTCTEQGFVTHTCNACGDSYVDTYVDALGHDMGEWTTITEATCTESGSERRDCFRCAHYETRVIAATGHSFGAWFVNRSATCTEDGENRRNCANCSHYETEVISATGHDYDAVVTEPTCTAQGFTTHTCASCGNSYMDTYVNALGHDMSDWETVKEANCTESGSERRDCSRCDHYETRTVDATGHSFGGWFVNRSATCTEDGENRRSCTNCSHYETEVIPATGHDYEAAVTAPTCTEQGFTTHTCSACGDSYVDSYTAALGHDWDEGIVTVEPTEDSLGEMTYTCERCGETRTEVIPELEHEHRYDAVVTDPTCTAKGYTTHTCRCGDSYVDTYVDALGHDMGEWVTVTQTTCTNDGSERRDCSRCDHYEIRVVNAAGHSFGSWFVNLSPTCTEDGENRRNCANCSHYETEVIPATGHDYESVVTAPTCTERGYTTHTCSACGDTYVDTYVEALGHDMGEWEIVIDATCTEDGQELRECFRCDHYETRIIAAVGHSYDAVVTAPTCTEQGYTRYVCSVCDDSYISDYVAPTGHDYEAVVTAPTCTEQGYTTYTCHCGDRYVSDYTAALGHDMGDWETVVEATCTETGEQIRDCSRCEHAETRAMEAMGHDWDEGTVSVEPTEETAGEMTYTCERCGETRTEIIPELEHEHRYDAVVTVPTCTEQGYTTHTCRCGDSYVDSYVDALGHDMGEWFTVTEATCTSDGVEQRECSRCEHYETQVIEATGHDYESAVTNPTCTAQGFTTHTCHCGDSYTDSYTSALGHSFTEYVSDGNATCTQDGTRTAVCDRCDATDTVIDEGSAHGHDFTEWSVILKPTETAEGLESRSCVRCGVEETRTIARLENPFADVPSDSFYYEPVMWAVANGVTNGTSATTFGPNDQCMRAHVVTFLWRAVGSPEPTRTDNPFVDVKETDFYYKAVMWALENGITSGMDATHFGPTAYCNRAQVVTFLYRTMGSPEVESTTNPFMDVAEGSFYEKAVLWAVENGITNGLSATAFGPNAICNRAQIVTFLYRAFVEE